MSSIEPKEKIRVYLLDDHSILREGFANALNDERDMRVVGQAATGAQVLKETVEIQPDIVITDLSRPTDDGRKAARRQPLRR